MTLDPRDWSAVTSARLPANGLACLAALRHRPEVRVSLTGDGDAWVQWPAGAFADETVSALRPAAGVEFYARHTGVWRRFGSRLPSGVTPPTDAGRSLAEVLTFAPPDPTPATANAIRRVRVEPVRDDVPRPATALRCELSDLRAWAEFATTRQLAGFRVAMSGGEVLVLGTLPTVASAQRYWGDSVHLPLGFTLRPSLGLDSLRRLVEAAAGDRVFWHADGVDVVPDAAFGPASRAGVRLADERGASS